jgi:ParB family chromosome partitioning protein
MAKDFRGALRNSVVTADKGLEDRFARADSVLLNTDGIAVTDATFRAESATAVHAHEPATFRAESQPADSKAEVLVNVDDLRPNPFNPRKFYSDEVVSARAASLLRDGQQYPIQIAPDPEGVIIDGEYRWRATKKNNGTQLRAIWRHDLDTPLKLYFAARACNVERQDQTAFDDAIAWRQLIDARQVKGEVELAEHLGINLSIVNRTLALSELPDSIVEILLQRPIGYRAGYEIYLYFKALGGAKAGELARRFVAEDLSTRQLEAIRKEATEPSARRARATPLTLKLDVRGVTGQLKAFPDGRLSVELKGLGGDAQHDLLDWLQQALESRLSAAED